MNKLTLISGLIALFSLIGCHSEHTEHKEKPTFKVTSPHIESTSIIQEYVSQIHSVSHIDIRSQERGFIQEFFVDEGQHVKKGQALFQIMPALYEAEFAKAKAEADLARIEFLTTKSLADSNIVSANELAMTKAKYDKANAELSLAQVHLGFTKIRAPFDGIIDRFQVRLGSLVDEGELITTLSDNSEMWVYFNVPEAEYLDYMSQKHDSSKQKVRLKMANNKYFEFEGEVTAIEADFNNETGNIPFRATFPNPKGLLRHGETGNVQMTSILNQAMLIPQKATYEILEKKYVFVVDSENVIHSKEIRIAQELPHLFVIESGIKPTDKILLEGIRKVRDGDEIKYEFLDPKTVTTSLGLYSE